MQTFISRDEFVGEGQARHEASLLEPEDGSKRTREEDTLDGSECYDTFTKGGFLIGNPGERPFGFSCNGTHRLDGIEELDALGGFADVSVDEEGVDFGVDVFAVLSTSRCSARQTR